jgi:hypothetical protein
MEILTTNEQIVWQSNRVNCLQRDNAENELNESKRVWNVECGMVDLKTIDFAF